MCVWSKDTFLWRPISIVNRALLPVSWSATNGDVKTGIPGAGSFLLGFTEGGSWVRVNLPQTQNGNSWGWCALFRFLLGSTEGGRGVRVNLYTVVLASALLIFEVIWPSGLYCEFISQLCCVVMRRGFTGIDNGRQGAPVFPLRHRIINILFSNPS